MVLGWTLFCGSLGVWEEMMMMKEEIQQKNAMNNLSSDLSDLVYQICHMVVIELWSFIVSLGF